MNSRFSADFFFSYNRMPEARREVNIPARDQVQLKTAKPKRADDLGHVEIEKDKAKLAAIVQGPEVPPGVEKHSFERSKNDLLNSSKFFTLQFLSQKSHLFECGCILFMHLSVFPASGPCQTTGADKAEIPTQASETARVS